MQKITAGLEKHNLFIGIIQPENRQEKKTSTEATKNF